MRCLQDSLSLYLVFQARMPSNMTSSSLTPSSHRFLGFSYPSFHCSFSWCLLLSVFQTKVTVCSLGIGATFGESVLDDLPREGTVVTRSTVELLRIERRDFRHIWEVSAFSSTAFDLQERDSNTRTTTIGHKIRLQCICPSAFCVRCLNFRFLCSAIPPFVTMHLATFVHLLHRVTSFRVPCWRHYAFTIFLFYALVAVGQKRVNKSDISMRNNVIGRG